MTDTPAKPRGRRPGRADTRGSICRAALSLFSTLGYDKVSLRAIARAADVDPALIHPYFSSMSDLFAQTVLALPLDADRLVSDVLAGPRNKIGHAAVAAFLAAYDGPDGGRERFTAMLRSAYSQFVYLAGGADHDQMEKLRQFMSTLCAGWDVQTVREIVADTLHNVVEPLVYDEAVHLIEQHHAAGRDVIIVSTSGSEVVEPIGAMLGADHVVATRMKVKDGKYTGEIKFYAYADNKAKAIRDLARKRGYDLDNSYAYSDSITDVAMLESVGNAFVVNPDKELRKVARERGWPVLEFTKPVALQSRVKLPPAKPTLAALAVGGAVALGGVVWANRRRAQV